MADDVTYPIPDGFVQAVDVIAGVGYPRAKVVWGPDGTVNDTDVATGKPMPVQLRGSDGTDRSNLMPVSDGGGSLTVDGTVAVTVPSDPFGVNADAASATGSISAKLKALATALGVTALDLGVSTGGTRTLRVAIDTAQLAALATASSAYAAGVQPVALPSDQVKIPVNGNTAHDGVDADKPIKIGGFAKAAAPADVSADGDVVNAWHLRNGAYAVNITAAGALIGATSNALDINIKSGNPTTMPVTNAGTFAVQAVAAGDVAHDGVDSGNPVKIGGKAVSSEPAAVSAADRTNLITDLVGKLIVLPYANPENFVSGAITSAMTGTTTTSLIAAPAAGLRNYITQITVSNAHATVGTDVIIQDGSGGTTLYTIPAAAVYGGAVITFPTPLRQPTTATAIFCANVTTGASTKVSASGYKGA